MDIRESISCCTNVSIILANHLLSKKSANSNVVFSPISLYVVLGLVATGSKGPTHEQLLYFLKAITIDELNALFSQLLPFVFADGSPSGGPRVCFANSVWVDQTLALLPTFKQVVDGVYKAASNQADFITKVSFSAFCIT
ncbi:hypothetical protein OSB04_003338 [Centaurea solstitialis]|uniref:Serpin domain-containing protein n=1 Tax=Centaurea solstitialis TaxID=347529 RepID=A0AA38UBX9_9ASTR|nr:hypothetical protein OSB04_003338 [Centaurea solstitialis]